MSAPGTQGEFSGALSGEFSERAWLRTALCALTISAGTTWLCIRSKLSPGPYRLVGMSE